MIIFLHLRRSTMPATVNILDIQDIQDIWRRWMSGLSAVAMMAECRVLRCVSISSAGGRNCIC
jgi:hypothetical protein